MTDVTAKAHPALPLSQEKPLSHTPPSMASTSNFNRLARIYRWLEYLTFGPFLWRCRIHLLPQLVPCRRALVLGDGDGRFTARLLRENPNLEVTAVDGSPRMIQSLEQASAHNRSCRPAQLEPARFRRIRPDRHAFFPRLSHQPGSLRSCQPPDPSHRAQCALAGLRVRHSTHLFWANHRRAAGLVALPRLSPDRQPAPAPFARPRRLPRRIWLVPPT